MRRRWPFLLVIGVFILAVGIPLFVQALGGNGPGPHPASKTDPSAARSTPAQGPAQNAAQPTTGTRAALVDWTHRALSKKAVIAGDRATTTALRAVGFRSAISFAGVKSTPLQTIDYVADVRGAPAPTGAGAAARTTLVGRSLPLALFGRGSDRATLRQLFPNGVAAARRHRTADTRLQKVGGRELLANRAIVPDAETRALSRSGDLDLRIETVLAQLATGDTVYVTDPERDPAEARARQPVRSIVLTTGDAQATRLALDAMTVPYRPEIVQHVSPRKFRLVWQPAIAPATSVGD